MSDVRLPNYSIVRVMNLRKQLILTAEILYNRWMDGENLQHLLDRVCDTLPGSFTRDLLLESLRDVSGRELKREYWADVAWRLAGNLSRLRKGVPATPWTGQREEEWCPVQVEWVEPKWFKKTQTRGAAIGFRVLAGTPTGMLSERFWSFRFMKGIRTELGFSRRGDRPEKVQRGGKSIVRNFPFYNPTEFTRLRLWGLFTPEHSGSGTPGFFQVACSNTFRTGWNRTILLARTHLEPPCPRDYTHQCYLCPVGYLSCPAGCHRHDFVCRVCYLCEQQAWHNPAHGPGSACIACHGKEE